LRVKVTTNKDPHLDIYVQPPCHSFCRQGWCWRSNVVCSGCRQRRRRAREDVLVFISTLLKIFLESAYGIWKDDEVNLCFRHMVSRGNDGRDARSEAQRQYASLPQAALRSKILGSVCLPTRRHGEVGLLRTYSEGERSSNLRTWRRRLVPNLL